MAKIDIISGFLGAGKTTLIKKLLKEAFQQEQVVLIENEFGEIGIDGGFLKEAGIEIREMNSGCICCSLVGDFGASLKEVIEKYHPDRILIEPSGVGKLSDVIKAVENVKDEADIELNSYTTVVDVNKCKMYLKNFGEFYSNQVETAGAIILSRTDVAKEGKAEAAVALLREMNPNAAIITTPIEQLDGAKILETMEHVDSLEKQMMEEEMRRHEQEHRYDHGADCTCGCHDHGHSHGCEHPHDHEHHHEHECHHGHEHAHEYERHHSHEHVHEHECHHSHEHPHEHECHHGHEHSHDHECHHGHEHPHDQEHCHDDGVHHGHDHGPDCTCGCHDHDHHHGHHHADEVFSSWGHETTAPCCREKLEAALAETRGMEGVYYVRAWLNEGELKPGEDIMYVLVGGDIRPRVEAALRFLVGKLKGECVREEELFG